MLKNKIHLLLCFLLPAMLQPLFVAADSRPDSFDVVHYTIELDLTQVSTKTIAGKTGIKCTAKINNLDKLRLDLVSLNVDSIKQNNKSLSFQQKNGAVLISLDKPVAFGADFDIEIYYHGQPEQDASGFGGFYFTSGYAFNMGVGFSVDPHVFGRAWFPCVDNFTDKATYSFYIKTSDQHKSYCNGILKTTTDNGDNTITWHWEMEQIIPTYLASVAVGNYTDLQQFVQLDRGPTLVKLGVYPQDSAAALVSFGKLPDALHAFEKAYGPYRFDRVGYVAVPFTSGAMEHATNIAYPRNAVVGGLAGEYLWAHELSHHWWGDNITCSTAADMWLNEGWASFSERLFMESVYGKEVARKYALGNHYNVLRYAHWTDGGYIPIAPVSHENTYGAHVYKKGADAAHALRYQMGDDSFFKAIKLFQEKFAFKNVNSEDFKNHLKSFYPYAEDFFNNWIYEPGFTHVAITNQSYKSVSGSYELNLNLKQSLKETNKPYNNLKSYISVYDKKWDHKTYEVKLNQNGGISLQTNIEPVFVALNMNGELPDAITRDYDSIYQPGNIDFDECLLSLNNKTIPSPALFYVEHHWVGPENTGAPEGIRLSAERYWKLDGLWSAGFDASAMVNYDGRTPASGLNGGYLDNKLIVGTEDSLVLLYREMPSSAWQLYESCEIIKGNPNDKYGTVKINSLKKGDYAFGYYDYKAGIIPEDRKQNKLELYPNPASGFLNIKLEGEAISQVRIFDSSGKLCLLTRFKDGREIQQVDTGGISPGIYLMEVHADGKVYQKELIVVK